MTRRAILITVAAVAVVAALTAAGISTASSMTAPKSPVPTVIAESGPLSLDVHATGELRATRTVPISAPPVGGQLRVLSIASTGTPVSPGDVILEFDPIDQVFSLQQAESQLLEAEQEIVRLRANAAVSAAQARVDLLTAQFDVRRAELDVRGDADLIAANERRKRELTLEEARRRLAQLQEDQKSRAVTDAAQLAVVQERLNKEQLDAARARRNIDSLVVKASVAGLVVVRPNRDASGGFFFSGMALPEYKAGDTIGAGRPILDVFDISELEVRTRIDEHQRDNVLPGQAAAVTFDSMPGLEIAARVASVANLATRSRDTPGPGRQFDAALRLDRVDPRLRPGTSTSILLKGETVQNAVSLPRTAVFEKEGKPVVYVRNGGRFDAVNVEITHRTETHTAVTGINAGTEVALVNPERRRSGRGSGTGETPPPAGGAGRAGGGR